MPVQFKGLSSLMVDSLYEGFCLCYEPYYMVAAQACVLSPHWRWGQGSVMPWSAAGHSGHPALLSTTLSLCYASHLSLYIWSMTPGC